MSLINEVLTITDRFIDRKDPDSIDRQGRLAHILVVVLIFHAIMWIAFVKMEELERKHPRIIHDVDVQFEFTSPPSDPTFKVVPQEVPQTISLTEGQNPNPGSASSASSQEAQKVTVPATQEEQRLLTLSPPRARPIPSHKTIVAPPVNIITTNTPKAMPVELPKTNIAAKPPETPVTGIINTREPSGAPIAGGSPEGQPGAVGTGGTGTGGEGTGQGDPGIGTGFGTAGGAIATKLSSVGGVRAMGNIAPYRKDLLVRIAQNWQPKRNYDDIIVFLEIAKGGKLLRTGILRSSGNKKADKEALAAVEATEFAPLPDWFKGEALPFQVHLTRQEN